MRNTKIFLASFLLSITYSCNTPPKPTSQDGWRELFDGKTLGGWKAVAGGADFEVTDGQIIGMAKANTPNTFLVTEEEFGDFILELELKIEHVSSNSGIMVRGQFDPAARDGQGLVYGYQVEADPTDRAWSGGLYDEARRGWLYPLDLNPTAKTSFKMGEWNKYRIEAIGDEIRTWVNGQATSYVVDSKDAKGNIGLQVHSIQNAEDEGRKTYFRNVRVKTADLTPAALDANLFVVNTNTNGLTVHEETNGWKLLFDGTTSTGWKGAYKEAFPEQGWVINNGILTIQASYGSESESYGDIVTLEKYSAFDLAFDFKLSEGANSGIKYFVTLSEANKGSAIGLEYQLLDDEKHPDAKMGREGNRTLASLYDLMTAQKQPRFVKPIGEWNSGRVVVNPDSKVEHYLNGVKVLEYQRGSTDYRALVAESKYQIWENFGEAEEGHILLQDHGNEVNFKNIKIRPLK